MPTTPYVPVRGAGMAIGAGVAISSTALAMPSAIASMTCSPTLNGWSSRTSGDGIGVCTPAAPAAVDADAGAAESTLHASPMAAATMNVRTATRTDRASTELSCRKFPQRHSENADSSF
jgi:hypothetical protein